VRKAPSCVWCAEIAIFQRQPANVGVVNPASNALACFRVIGTCSGSAMAASADPANAAGVFIFAN
jgi:hypothetical protein